MLKINNLTKDYLIQGGNIRAVDNISFSVPKSKVFTLFGPSGCGKTTTLRLIAGIEIPTSGSLWLREQKVYDSKTKDFIPPNERNIGMVFQSYAIWPHMNVFENIAFPLKIRKGENKLSIREISEKVAKVLDLVKLAGYEQRPATQLSGGQQQRVALARALVGNPDLLILDEPLSNLDENLREHMRFELKQLQQKFALTIVYVTHDLKEAKELSDIIATMEKGKIMSIEKT